MLNERNIPCALAVHDRLRLTRATLLVLAEPCIVTLLAPTDPEVWWRARARLRICHTPPSCQGNTKHCPLTFSIPPTHLYPSIAPAPWILVRSKSSPCSRSHQQALSPPSENSSRMSKKRSELTCVHGHDQHLANGTRGSSSASLACCSSSCSSACLSSRSMSGTRMTHLTPPAECPSKHSLCRSARMLETASTT